MAEPVKLSAADLEGATPVETAEPKAVQLSAADLEGAQPVSDHQGIGFTGPGSKDPDADKIELAPTTGPKVSAAESFTRLAGAQVPFGRQTEAAFNTLPIVGTGKSYGENLSDITNREVAAQQQHPIASDLGKGSGFGLAALAGPAAAEGALAKGATGVASKLVGPGVSAVQGGLQAGSDSKADTFKGMALDVLGGTAVGAGVGALFPAIGAGIGKAVESKAGQKVLTESLERSDDRILHDIGTGAPKKMRDKIGERSDDAIELIRENPELSKIRTKPEKLAKATEARISKNGDELDRIYNTSEKVAGRVQSDGIVGRLKNAQAELVADGNIAGKPEAKAMQAHIDNFAEEIERAPGGISPNYLRKEITRLQGIAYDVGINAKDTPVRDAAGRTAGILKNVLEEHVDKAGEMIRGAAGDSTALVPSGVVAGNRATEEAGKRADILKQLNGNRVRELNAEQTALIRINKAANYKAKAQPHANTTRLAKIGHGIQSGVGSTIGAAAGFLGGGLGLTAAGAAAGAVLPSVARFTFKTADEGLAAVARSVRSGVRPTPELVDAAIKAGVKASTITALTSRLGDQ